MGGNVYMLKRSQKTGAILVLDRHGNEVANLNHDASRPHKDLDHGINRDQSNVYAPNIQNPNVCF